MIEPNSQDLKHSRSADPPLHLCEFPSLLYTDFEQRGEAFHGPYPHQRTAILKALLGLSILVGSGTGTGKTVDAFACLHWCLSKGLIGVYLVPHKRLLWQVWEQITTFFNLPTLHEPPQERVHVIMMSGEEKPSKEELQKYSSKLVIVATYEAFRAFCFEVQSRRYFRKRRCFGTVVIDEAHYVNDPERGMSLRTLIYKLKQEYDPQFCLLSGTFAKEDAEWWCTQLGCIPIEDPTPLRVFNYKETLLELEDEPLEGTDLGGDKEKVRGHPSYTILEQVKVSRIAEELAEYLADHENESQKILIFCYARWLANDLARFVRDHSWGRGNIPPSWCEPIHAGLIQQEQEAVFAQFKATPPTPIRAQILVSSPLLETGINVPKIDLVIVVDPELYTATQLAQMCGRLRKKRGQVMFLVTDRLRPLIDSKFKLNEAGTQIIQFNLKFSKSEFPRLDLKRLLLEQLFWHQRTKAELQRQWNSLSRFPFRNENEKEKDRIQRFITKLNDLLIKKSPEEQVEAAKQLLLEQLFWFNQTEEELRQQFDHFSRNSVQKGVLKKGQRLRNLLEEWLEKLSFKHQLEELLKTELVRKIGGKYALTFTGDAVVETGIDTDAALDELKLVTLLKEGRSDSLFYFNHLAKLVAERVTVGIHDFARRKERQAAIERFMQKYNAKHPADNVEHRATYKIDAGDEEIYRRTAIWLAASMVALYRGQQLQQAPKRPTVRSYYDKVIPPNLEQQTQFLTQHISRFQLPGSPRRRKKPDPLPRSASSRSAQYIPQIEKVLQTFNKAGATIRELHQALHKEGIKLSNSCLNAALNGPLESKIFKELESKGQSHRPAFRYWLKKHKRSPLKLHLCKDCKYFREKRKYYVDLQIKTHCKLGFSCESKWVLPRVPCDHFQVRPRKHSFFLYYPRDFISGTGTKIRCPHCGFYDTVLIPRLRKMTICQNCKILLKQVRKGRYYGRLGIFDALPEDRINDRHSRPYIIISKEPRTVYLKQGETLFVEDTRVVGISILKVQGRKAIGPFKNKSKSTTFFLEEIFQIILAGGTIQSGNALLKKYGISIIDTPPLKLEQKLNEEILAQDLRIALSELPGPLALKIAGEWVVAKTLSNISYTFAFGQLYPKLQLPLIYRQFDQIAQIYLLLAEMGYSGYAEQVERKYPLDHMNIFRGREGAADSAAWELIKVALPWIYRFHSRKEQRAIWTDLITGPKAFDAFNCALNCLFGELTTEVMTALQTAGFSKYFPGPGLLHRRHRRPPVVEHHTNRTLLFDFMDSYRPPFRYYLLAAFHVNKLSLLEHHLLSDETPLETWCLHHTLSGMDFEGIAASTSKEVITPSELGLKRLKKLFNLVCDHPFLYQGATLPLREIMRREAQSLKAVLLSASSMHKPFSFFSNERLTAFYQPLVEVLKLEAHPLSSKELSKSQPVPVPPASLKEPSITPIKNIIIVTHVDADGFLSALLLSIKYSFWDHPRRGKVQVLTATPKTIRRVLEEKVPNLLWKDPNTQNLIIIADLAIPEDRPFLRTLRDIYLKRLNTHAERLEIHWYDHHPFSSSIDIEELHTDLGIEFRHNPSLNSFEIIRQELEEDLDRLDQIERVLKQPLIQGGLGLISVFLQLIKLTQYRKRSYFETKLQDFKGNFKRYLQHFAKGLELRKKLLEKTPWAFFSQLILTSDKQLQKVDDPAFLRIWIRWFEDYHAGRHKRPQRNWFHRFKAVLTGKQPPQGRPSKEVVPATFKKSLYHATIHQTQNGKTFAALVPYKPLNIRDLFKQVWKETGRLPDFFVVLFPSDFSIEIRATRRNTLDFSGLATDQGARGHPGALRIYRPWQKVYQIGKDPSLYFCSYLPYNEFIERLCKIAFTAHPEPLTVSSDKITEIPIREEKPKPITLMLRGEALQREEELKARSRLILEFGQSTQLRLPQDDVTLCYSDKKQGLYLFLHYLLYTYLSTRRAPQKIIWIETLQEGLDFRQIIALANPKDPTALLRNILFTKIPDLRLFSRFIKQQLKSIILFKDIRARLVVITAPLALIKEYWKDHEAEPKHTSGMFHTGGDFIKALQTIAKETNATIILSETGALRNRADGTIHPWIQVSAENNLRYKINIAQSVSNYALQIVTKSYESLAQYSSSVIPFPPDQRRKTEALLANLSKLPNNVDLIFPTPPSSLESGTQTIDWTNLPREAEEEKGPPFADEGTLFPLKIFNTGLKVLICRPTQYKRLNKKVALLLVEDERERAMDLIEWPDQSYSIYLHESDLDLSALQQYGGELTSKGMYFHVDSALPFNEFLEKLTNLFFGFQHLLTFLGITRDNFKIQQSTSSHLAKLLSIKDDDITQLVEKLLPLFTHPLPTIEDTEVWTEFIENLHTYFNWSTIDDITETILGELSFIDRQNHDKGEIQTVIQSCFKKRFYH